MARSRAPQPVSPLRETSIQFRIIGAVTQPDLAFAGDITRTDDSILLDGKVLAYRITEKDNWQLGEAAGQYAFQTVEEIPA